MDLKELETFALHELAKHGLHDWTFAFTRARRQLGVCKYRRKCIEIAEFYARNNPLPSVLDTLLHEIAHALAGAAAGHGPAWKAVALRLGAKPEACDHSSATVLKPGDWQATCPACKRVIHRYRRPVTLTGYKCNCAAGARLLFEFKGDPALKPQVPMTAHESAKWEAQCIGCQTVHFRLRKPKAGVWRCKCAHGCELSWRYRPAQN